VLEFTSNIGVNGLVDNQIKPTSGVGVLCPELGIKNKFETTGNDAGSEDIGQGQPFANEEGVLGKVVLENADDRL
jgi:hypothetical protein